MRFLGFPNPKGVHRSFGPRHLWWRWRNRGNVRGMVTLSVYETPVSGRAEYGCRVCGYQRAYEWDEMEGTRGWAA